MRTALLLGLSSVLLAMGLGVACSDEANGGATTAVGAGGPGGTGGTAATGGGTVATGGAGAGGAATSGGGQGGTGGAAAPADFRETGPYQVVTSQGSQTTTSGCNLEYDLYEPQGSPWDGIVVVSHGYQCARQHVADWARHWASWGLRAVAPDLCHSSIVDLNQYQNGLDVMDLAAALSDGPPIYAGHSAGGLASLVAAANDPTTLCSLGLDPAEWSGYGTAAAPNITSPAYALLGIPVLCNGMNNALPLYGAMGQARVLRAVEADHCDFSSPNTCTECQLGCGSGTNVLFSDEQITATIRGLSTAFVVWQAGLDVSGEGWWTQGQPAYETLLVAGSIAEM